MVKQANTAYTEKAIEDDLAILLRSRGDFHCVVVPIPLTQRVQIIAEIPSAADLDLIVIDPPAEWLADKGWK